MKSIPNIISASRGIASFALLFLPAFTLPFWVIYCWCGFSDMIDGPIARKINAASELGSKIDSIADIVFVICAAIRILPSITLPSWIWIWMAGIGVVKLVGICVNSRCHGHFFIKHSSLNKLTGFLLFCLPFTIVAFTPVVPAVVICTVASISTVADFS